MKIRTALIGHGYWGSKYYRILNEHPDVDLTVVCEADKDKVKSIWNEVMVVNEIRDWKVDELDAFIIATPVTTHFNFALRFLMDGKHVLVEKALTNSSEAAQMLVDAAVRYDAKLATAHTYEYNSYVQEIKRMITEGYLGDVYYVNMTRVGNSPIRQDVSCIWDLAPHDISMLLYWFDEMPESVTAFGQSYLQDEFEDVGYINLRFSKNKIANIRCSWVNPIKRRNVTIVGSKRMISFDDVARTLEVYEGDKKEVLNIEYKEPLKEQVNDFIDAIISNREPKVNGERGLNVVRVLEQCQQSLRANYMYHQRIKLEV